MIIKVASMNPVKINAVKEAISDYSIFNNAEIIGVKIKSGVGEQPMSLEATVQGALNRANKAFQFCNYSFGIESGFMEIPNFPGVYNFTSVVVYDGKKYSLGTSSGFQVPPKALEVIRRNKIDLDAAIKLTGISDNPIIGKTNSGVIGILTNGKISRKDYTKEAIIKALIPIIHPEWY